MSQAKLRWQACAINSLQILAALRDAAANESDKVTFPNLTVQLRVTPLRRVQRGTN